MDPIQTTLANERRIQILETKVAKEEGIMQGTRAAQDSLAVLCETTLRELDRDKQELATLRAGAGPGITDNFREVTSTDNFANAERTAGQTAVVMAIKGGNTTMTAEEAKEIWSKAALAARPADRQWLLCDHNNLMLEYQANVGVGSWEELRDWLYSATMEQMGLA